MLFFQVAVEWSLAGYGGRHVDRVRDGRIYRGASGFMYTDQRDVRGFVGCGITEGEYAELAGGSFGLQAEPDVHDALAGSVGVHPDGGIRALENQRFFLEVIGRRRFGRSLTKLAAGKKAKKSRAKGRISEQVYLNYACSETELRKRVKPASHTIRLCCSL
jgi:hypothetical protein